MNFDPLCDIELDKPKQLRLKLGFCSNRAFVQTFKFWTSKFATFQRLNDIFELSYDFCLKTKK